MTKDIKKWWNEVSKSYQIDSKIRTKSAHYGPYSPDEKKLKLLGNVKGKKILEVGCGGGQCSIAFAKQGAKCTGLDLSKEQLKHAEELAKKEKVSVKFLKHDIQTLKGIKSKEYDIVFTAFALQYIPNLTKCFKEVHRVLKRNGLFVLSLDHPFFMVIDTKTNKIKRSYFKTGKIEEIDVWPDSSKHKFVIYRRKISDIFNSLTEAKFFVEKIIEPLSKNAKSWKWEEIYPKELVKLVGPTIIFKTKKK
ncbi:hypothetical protein CL617_04590 [archaeon]|nr:hypothetical protein [archaeon]|tara:strand:- start:7966 stop:8712 length:747 start_codon:yes stop_codon:yes gene_type:complete